MLFAGWAVAAAIIPRLSDVFGRKRVYIVSMFFMGLFWIFMVFSTSRRLTTALMFFWGMASCGRAAVGYLYMAELCP